MDLRFRSSQLKWLAAAIAAMFVYLPIGFGMGADRVTLRRGDVGPEREFFERLLQETRVDCRCDFTMDHFHIGRFDLNDNGLYELFVRFGHIDFCGSRGCESVVYEWLGHDWEEIGESRVMVDDERIGGYRTLLGHEDGYRWGTDETTGESGYQHFCRALRCLEDYDVEFWRLSGPALARWADRVPGFATEWILLRREVFGLERDFIAQLHRTAIAECRCKITTFDLSVGRFDLDGDGQYELFVAYRHPYFCDDAGCRNPVFQWRDGKWRRIAALDGGWWWRPEYIWVLGKHRSPDGYPILLGRHMGVRWVRNARTGRAGYQPFCLSDDCVRKRGYRLGVK